MPLFNIAISLTHHWRHLLFFLMLALLPPASAENTRPKTLHWDALEVRAHLDAEGTLHVSELHAMVFDGDWNGGERRFFVGPRQTLTLERIVRIDARAREHVLTEGTLDAVDEFAWTNTDTLRWRARLPKDPPFRRSALAWRIDYTLSGIIEFSNNGYRLDHDFAFPDRLGNIHRFALNLTLDPVWVAREPIEPFYERRALEPGTSVVMSRTLRHLGNTPPAAVWHGAPVDVRANLRQVLFGGGLLLLIWFLWQEKRAGRFRRLIPLADIDRTWIEREVLVHAPEVVGALWDDTLGPPEVAAMLARMEQEGKIRSRIERKTFWLFGWNTMTLTLTASRAQLVGHELALVEALFVDGDTTNRDLLQKHYRRSGFSPVDTVSNTLFAKAEKITGPTSRVPWYVRSMIPIFFFVSMGMFVVIAFTLIGVSDESEVFGMIPVVFINILFLLVGMSATHTYQNAHSHVTGGIVRMVLTAAVFAAPILWLLQHNPWLFSERPFVLYVGIWLWWVWMMLSAARTRVTPKQMEVHRRFRSARAWFASELKKPAPALDDSWYPYLLAFGLGNMADHWSFIHGQRSERSNSSEVRNGSGSGVSGGSWSGGGGTFAGAGASGSWAAAAGAFSSSVPSPSRGSSGGGSGSSSSGSSSGGGGGGGW